jgi:hypothetical protein
LLGCAHDLHRSAEPDHRDARKHFATTDLATVRNVYRTDRCVSLVNDAGDRFPVSFDDLRKRWKLVAAQEPPASMRGLIAGLMRDHNNQENEA